MLIKVGMNKTGWEESLTLQPTMWEINTSRVEFFEEEQDAINAYNKYVKELKDGVQ